MADPIIENAVRAQCIWQAPSGLPEDRFVTTWAFVRGAALTGDAATQADEVAERLREFWLEQAPGASQPVAGFIPAPITIQGLEIRCYDLGQAPPREPRVYNYPFASGSGGAPFPYEVAVTMSFYADRNLPRRRGRVYIGPLAATAMGAQATQVSRPLADALNGAAERLALGTGLGDRMLWSVLSGTDAEIRPVTAGWVDDAFDTVRRRGNAATNRWTWPTT